MYKHLLKRIIDLTLSFIGIIVLIPLWIILSVIIFIDNPGPIFFSQTRSGKNKKPFKIIKFRTIKTGAPKDMPTNKLQNSEQYITRFGKFLRKTSLDELPQLFNIFVGQMSIVGPRPVILKEQDLIQERDKYGANSVKPGLTGWAQVNGRDTLDFETKAKYDGEYVEKIGIFFDIKCILKTIKNVVSSDGVVDGMGDIQEDKESPESEMLVANEEKETVNM